MSNDFFEEAELELDPDMKGRELTPQPKGLTSAELATLPDNLSSASIERQLPRGVWRANRSILNPDLILHMHKLTKKGLSQRAVCARSGISEATWWTWERKAAAGEEPYTLWYACMIHAASLLEEDLIDNVKSAANVDWKAATWLLGRINREAYAETKGTQVNNFNVSGDVNGEQTTVNSMSDDDAQRIATLMGKIGALPSAEPVDAEVVEDDE